ncbi:MAG: GAF domain-containing protein [Actinomycetia bacterium]|nr:GAF domain-containing protein [Actinomycetes bacterium]
MQARARLQGAIDEHSGLLEVVEATAVVICQELSARTVTVTLLKDDMYRDIVKVGDYDPAESIDVREQYPAFNYPEATARLLANQAYVSSDSTRDIHHEHLQIVPEELVSGFLGVPIVADGQVRGEVFATRRAAEPPFTADDVEVARDLATQLGGRFPTLLAEYALANPDW